MLTLEDVRKAGKLPPPKPGFSATQAPTPTRTQSPSPGFGPTQIPQAQPLQQPATTSGMLTLEDVRKAGRLPEPKPGSAAAKSPQPSGLVAPARVNTSAPLEQTVGGLIGGARSYIGTPYQWGGVTRGKGADCSGMVWSVFKEQGIELPRTAAEQWKATQRVTEPRPGDIVFFRNTGNRTGITHNGIYIGNGRFIHQSTNKGGREDDLNREYNRKHFAGFGRPAGLGPEEPGSQLVQNYKGPQLSANARKQIAAWMVANKTGTESELLEDVARLKWNWEPNAILHAFRTMRLSEFKDDPIMVKPGLSRLGRQALDRERLLSSKQHTREVARGTVESEVGKAEGAIRGLTLGLVDPNIPAVASRVTGGRVNLPEGSPVSGLAGQAGGAAVATIAGGAVARGIGAPLRAMVESSRLGIGSGMGAQTAGRAAAAGAKTGADVLGKAGTARAGKAIADQAGSMAAVYVPRSGALAEGAVKAAVMGSVGGASAMDLTHQSLQAYSEGLLTKPAPKDPPKGRTANMLRGFDMGLLEKAQGEAASSGDWDRVAEIERKIREMPMSEATKKVMTEHPLSGEWWQAYLGEGGEAALYEMTRNLSRQAPEMAGRIAGMLAGGAVGLPYMGAVAAGTIPGGVGTHNVIHRSAILEYLREEAGLDLSDPEAVQKFMQDPNNRRKVGNFASRRAIPYTVVQELFNLGGAAALGKIADRPASTLLGRAARGVGATAADIGIQTAGEAVSEMASQAGVGRNPFEEQQVREWLLEAILGGSMSVAHTGGHLAARAMTAGGRGAVEVADIARRGVTPARQVEGGIPWVETQTARPVDIQIKEAPEGGYKVFHDGIEAERTFPTKAEAQKARDTNSYRVARLQRLLQETPATAHVKVEALPSGDVQITTEGGSSVTAHLATDDEIRAVARAKVDQVGDSLITMGDVSADEWAQMSAEERMQTAEDMAGSYYDPIGVAENGTLHLRDRATLREMTEEVAHWMEAAGIITPDEVKAVADWARAKYSLDPESSDSEAFAQAAAHYQAQARIPGTIRTILRRIAEFIETLTNPLYRPARAVMQDVISGQAQARQATGETQYGKGFSRPPAAPVGVEGQVGRPTSPDAATGAESSQNESLRQEAVAVRDEMRKTIEQLQARAEQNPADAERLEGHIRNLQEKMADIDAALESGGPLFSIIGERGMDENRAKNLDVAKQMQAAGKDAKTIWLATGWEMGTDGRWRSEIDTDQMRLALDRSAFGTLEDVAHFPDLYTAYPDIGSIESYITIDRQIPRWEESGAFAVQETLDPALFTPEESITIKATTPATARSLLLHEIQHAVQRREGFAPGGSVSRISDAVGDERFEAYRNLPGESEARRVQRRAKMTPEERAQTPLSQTPDGPRFSTLFEHAGEAVPDRKSRVYRNYRLTLRPFKRLEDRPKSLRALNITDPKNPYGWVFSPEGLTPEEMARFHAFEDDPLKKTFSKGQRYLAVDRAETFEYLGNSQWRRWTGGRWQSPEPLPDGMTSKFILDTPNNRQAMKALGRELIDPDAPPQYQGTLFSALSDDEIDVRAVDVAVEAQRLAPAFHAEIQSLARRLGMEYQPGEPKSATRLAEKVREAREENPEADFSVAKDHVRGWIRIADFRDAPRVMDALIENGYRIKTQGWASGYRGIHAVKEVAPGYNGEIQVHTDESWKLKQETEADYQAVRNLDETVPEQSKRIDAAAAKTRQLYDQLWEGIPEDVRASISSRDSSRVQSSLNDPAVRGPLTSDQDPSSQTLRPSSGSRQYMRPESSERTTQGSVDQSGSRIDDTSTPIIPSAGRESDAQVSAGALERSKEHFGTTQSIDEAGYVLPDGSMLDFSGRHQAVGYEFRDGRFVPKPGQPDYLRNQRNVDHREVRPVEGIKLTMEEFIDRGAVRIDSATGRIDLAVPPTRAQESRISEVVSQAPDGYVVVDLRDGDRTASVELPDATPAKVLGTIRRFFAGEDVGGIRFSIKDPDPDAEAEKYIGSINWEKLDITEFKDPDHMRRVMETTAEQLVDEMTDQRRGVIPWTETQAKARLAAMKITPRMISRLYKPGTALNAEHLTAAAMVFMRYAKKMEQTALAYSATHDASDELAHHAAIREYETAFLNLNGFKTEAGRALNACKILSQAAKAQTPKQRVIDMLNEIQGDQLAQAQVELLAQIPETDHLRLMRMVTDATRAKMRWGDKLEIYFLNNILSGITSHSSNALGNIALQVLEEFGAKPMAAAYDSARSSITGKERSFRWKPIFLQQAQAHAWGETAHMFGAAVRATAQSAKYGMTERAAQRMDLPKRAMEFADYEIKGVRIPNWKSASLRLLGMEDAFFRTITTQSHINTMAMTKAENALARRKKGYTPDEVIAEYSNIKNNLMDHPEILDTALSMEDHRLAMKKPGRGVQKGLDFINWEMPGTGFRPGKILLAPIQRVPVNIFRLGIEYSPAGFAKTGYEHKKGMIGDYESSWGYGRAIYGTAAMLMMFAGIMYGDWEVIGEFDEMGNAPLRKLKQAEGQMSWGIRIGDRYVPFEVFQSLSVPAAFVATAANAMRSGDVPGATEAMMLGGRAMVRSLLDQSFLQGVNNGLKALTDPTGRTGEGIAAGTVRGMIPYSGLMTNIGNAFAEYNPDTNTGFADDNIIKNVARRSTSRNPLTRHLHGAEMDPLGRKVEQNPKGVAAFTRWLGREAKASDPVAKELIRLNYSPGFVGKTFSQGDQRYPMTREQWRAYQEEAGEAVHKALDRLFASSGYQRLDDEDEKIRLVKAAVERARGPIREKWRRTVLSERTKQGPRLRE